MKNFFGNLGIAILASTALVLTLLTMAQIIKPMCISTTHVEGRVIQIEENILTKCVKITLTTEGETLYRNFCVYHDLDLPRVKYYVKAKFVVSPWLFMDRLELEELEYL